MLGAMPLAPNQLRELREPLTRLYPTAKRARVVLDDAGVHHANIDLDGSATVFWHAILEEANRHEGAIRRIMDVVARDYPTAGGPLLPQAADLPGGQFATVLVIASALALGLLTSRLRTSSEPVYLVIGALCAVQLLRTYLATRAQRRAAAVTAALAVSLGWSTASAATGPARMSAGSTATAIGRGSAAGLQHLFVTALLVSASLLGDWAGRLTPPVDPPIVPIGEDAAVDDTGVPDSSVTNDVPVDDGPLMDAELTLDARGNDAPEAPAPDRTPPVGDRPPRVRDRTPVSDVGAEAPIERIDFTLGRRGGGAATIVGLSISGILANSFQFAEYALSSNAGVVSAPWRGRVEVRRPNANVHGGRFLVNVTTVDTPPSEFSVRITMRRSGAASSQLFELVVSTQGSVGTHSVQIP